jgi:CubicO group peptidase (beta-lactamase class C family)
MPLAYQPGTTFDYGYSTDVLGRIVEVVSGKPLDAFIAERLAKPLKLADTAFSVPQRNAERVAEPQVMAATGKRPPAWDPTARTAYPSGGSGMLSTAADYLSFGQMLLNGGELDGARLLSPKTVAYMTANHLAPSIAYSLEARTSFGAVGPTPEQGQGFGLGFAVRTDYGRNPQPGSPGLFYWVGSRGTAFWVDPAEKLVAVMMIQVPPSDARKYRGAVRNLVYQAMTK